MIEKTNKKKRRIQRKNPCNYGNKMKIRKKEYKKKIIITENKKNEKQNKNHRNKKTEAQKEIEVTKVKNKE